MLTLLARKAITAAALTAAAAAGSYVMKRALDRRRFRKHRRERLDDMARWEGEGGAPRELRSAAPHEEPEVR